MPSPTAFVPINRAAKRRGIEKPTDNPSANTGENVTLAVQPIDQTPAPKPPSLDRLPPEIRGMIYSSLDYQSLIRLSTTSRFFHRTVDPQALADTADKVTFIMTAVRDFPQHFAREKISFAGNYECYICFRVRGPELFDTKQAHQVSVDAEGRLVLPPRTGTAVVNIRRFCIECGLKTGLHAPSDTLETKAGREFWVCRCRKLWAKSDVLKCTICGEVCPFRARKEGCAMASAKVPETTAMA